MSFRVHVRHPASAPLASARRAQVTPPRPFPEAALTSGTGLSVERATRLGHHLRKIPVRAERQGAMGGGVTAAAPIQCAKWKKGQGAAKKRATQVTTTQPDVTYSQAKDPTVKPFLKRGEFFMGEAGAKKQLKGVAPSPDEIRVRAVSSPNLRSGSGLHEIVPTNLLKLVAETRNSALTGVQSGARSSTGSQLLSTGGGQVGAHTGFAVKPKGTGSTHTKGQAKGHDLLRDAVRKNKHESDPYILTNMIVLAHLKHQPTGLDIMKNNYITDMLPNQKQFGILEPVDKIPGPNRRALAQWYQEIRERVKDNLRSLKRNKNRGESPSPPREKIDAKGLGGGYISAKRKDYPVVRVPKFEQKTAFEKAANMSAWMTAPQRERFDPSLPFFKPATSNSLGSKMSATGPNTITTSKPKKKRKLSAFLSPGQSPNPGAILKHVKLTSPLPGQTRNTSQAPVPRMTTRSMTQSGPGGTLQQLKNKKT